MVYFREFFYIQIEKYARQYLAEGIRKVEDLVITTDSDLYRVLNLHYNRSNQIDVCARCFLNKKIISSFRFQSVFVM